MTAAAVDEVSGRTIISDYKAGKAAGVATYGKLCRAIDFIDRWQPSARTHFLEQFVNIGGLLDSKCKVLVDKLSHLSWSTVPPDIRQQFIEMLRGMAVQHVCHTETIISSFVEQFVVKTCDIVTQSNETTSEPRAGKSADTEAIVSESELQEIFDLAHDSLVFVLKCFPMSVKLLIKPIQRNFPHVTVPIIRYKNYIRNIILVGEYALETRPDILSLIVDHLTQIDTLVSKRLDRNVISEEEENSNDSSGIFVMDEELDQSKAISHEIDDKNRDRVEKLDISMCYVFSYIAKSHGVPVPLDIAPDVNWILDSCRSDGLYMHLRSAFEEHLLMANGVNNIPFIWLYICSLKPAYASNFIQWLWSFVIRPSQSPSDWKKAHGAACYLGSFLSRASYVDLKFCLGWMERLTVWCTQYVNETTGSCSDSSSGTLRHGTFYAVCQAVLVVFTFRYREIVSADELDNIRRWGFGHIIHSTLEPLRYISRPVALCFATISRSLQLVYCNHILPVASTDERASFEPNFPLDSYCLPRSSVFVASLIRRFSPMAEDVAALAVELSWRNAKQSSGAADHKNDEEAAGSLDFLEDLSRDREILNENEYNIQRKDVFAQPAADIFTVYSESPGLMHFCAPSSLMDIS